MAWAWLSVCCLALLSSKGVPGQTDSWTSGNLQGQMFSLMKYGNVRFRSDSPSNFTGLTVCFRVLTDKPYYSIQLTLENQTSVVRLEVYQNHYNLYINSSVSFDQLFMVPAYQELWPWKNRCFTWESSSGMAQLWSDGKMSVRKGISRGQEFSGLAELSFDQFEGQVTDVNVWDSALSTNEIDYFLYSNYAWAGEILNWRQIQYSTYGYTVLEPIFTKPYSAKSTGNKKQKLRRRNKK